MKNFEHLSSRTVSLPSSARSLVLTSVRPHPPRATQLVSLMSLASLICLQGKDAHAKPMHHYLTEARTLLRANQPDRLEKLMRSAFQDKDVKKQLAEQPKSCSELYERVLDAFALQKKYQEVLRESATLAANQVDPTAITLLRTLEAYRNLGRSAEAIAFYEQEAVHFPPHMLISYDRLNAELMLARVDRKLPQDLIAARKAYEERLQKVPPSPLSYQLRYAALQLFLALNGRESALGLLQQLQAAGATLRLPAEDAGLPAAVAALSQQVKDLPQPPRTGAGPSAPSPISPDSTAQDLASYLTQTEQLLRARHFTQAEALLRQALEVPALQQSTRIYELLIIIARQDESRQPLRQAVRLIQAQMAATHTRHSVLTATAILASYKHLEQTQEFISFYETSQPYLPFTFLRVGADRLESLESSVVSSVEYFEQLAYHLMAGYLGTAQPEKAQAVFTRHQASRKPGYQASTRLVAASMESFVMLGKRPAALELYQQAQRQLAALPKAFPAAPYAAMQEKFEQLRKQALAIPSDGAVGAGAGGAHDVDSEVIVIDDDADEVINGAGAPHHHHQQQHQHQRDQLRDFPDHRGLSGGLSDDDLPTAPQQPQTPREFYKDFYKEALRLKSLTDLNGAAQALRQGLSLVGLTQGALIANSSNHLTFIRTLMEILQHLGKHQEIIDLSLQMVRQKAKHTGTTLPLTLAAYLQTSQSQDGIAFYNSQKNHLPADLDVNCEAFNLLLMRLYVNAHSPQRAKELFLHYSEQVIRQQPLTLPMYETGMEIYLAVREPEQALALYRELTLGTNLLRSGTEVEQEQMAILYQAAETQVAQGKKTAARQRQRSGNPALTQADQKPMAGTQLAPERSVAAYWSQIHALLTTHIDQMPHQRSLRSQAEALLKEALADDTLQPKTPLLELQMRLLSEQLQFEAIVALSQSMVAQGTPQSALTTLLTLAAYRKLDQAQQGIEFFDTIHSALPSDLVTQPLTYRELCLQLMQIYLVGNQPELAQATYQRLQASGIAFNFNVFLTAMQLFLTVQDPASALASYQAFQAAQLKLSPADQLLLPEMETLHQEALASSEAQGAGMPQSETPVVPATETQKHLVRRLKSVRDARSKGQLRKAEQLLQQALIDPKMGLQPELFNELMVTLAERRHFQGVLEVGQQMLRTQTPQNALTLTELLHAYVQKGQARDGMAFFQATQAQLALPESEPLTRAVMACALAADLPQLGKDAYLSWLTGASPQPLPHSPAMDALVARVTQALGETSEAAAARRALEDRHEQAFLADTLLHFQQ